jgi:hypothetical protein
VRDFGLTELSAGKKEILMKTLPRIGQRLLLLAVSFAPALSPATALARNAQHDDDPGVKQDVRDAAHSTHKAAKQVGRKTKKETKKIVNKSAEKTGEAADKVQDKTKP